MKQNLSYSADWLEQHKAKHTVNEICHQPTVWEKQWHALAADRQHWQSFLAPLLADANLQIILTGAGSSDFIGKAIAPWLREKTGRDVQAYGTTDIVSTPLQYLSPNRKTLVVSFGRSGNSPESVAAVALADQLVNECYHLMVTCNPNGELAKYAEGRANVCSLITPEGTHDQSFAMTSSFSSMMLTTILLLGFDNFDETRTSMEKMVAVSESRLIEWQEQTKALAKQDFKRIIYIGGSCFAGLAEEAALKVLELTAGRVITRFDSSLGLRHGPKFMIEGSTLVVCMLSNNDYVRQYDLDLLNEIARDGLAKQVIGLSGIASDNSNVISLDIDLNDIWLLFPYLIFAQMIAVETSLALGLTPDNPCPTGEVNRVVKGVNIYPFSK
jgi:tagatose-6-phosphate ketose/aldose isomerase